MLIVIFRLQCFQVMEVNEKQKSNARRTMPTQPPKNRDATIIIKKRNCRNASILEILQVIP